MKTIDRFEGKYYFLSNFAASRFIWNFTLYNAKGEITHIPMPYECPTVEHAYQALKTLNAQEMYNILRAGTAGKSKRLGRKATMRPDWDEVKDNAMLQLLNKKFADPYLREKLLETGEAVLIEGNSWHDNYWGDCDCANADGEHPECLEKGKNMLGYLLMQVRDRIRREQDEAAEE